MGRGSITQAVILAAGNGNRLSSLGVPKPLAPVVGRPLLEHSLNLLCAAGIKKVSIVVGYRGVEVQSHPFPSIGRDIDVEWVYNPQYNLENGMSLMAVDDRINAPFILLMADHFFEQSIVEQLLECEVPPAGGMLATDTKVGQIFDLDDATKVRTRHNRIQGIGKNIFDFNCVDTGMFLLSQAVFPAMKKSMSLGDASLTGAIRILAQLGVMKTWDIGPRKWVDVDTPEALAWAEGLAETGSFVDRLG